MTKNTYLKFWRPDRTSMPEAVVTSESRKAVERWRVRQRTKVQNYEAPSNIFEDLFIETNRLFNGYQRSAIMLSMMSTILGNTSTGILYNYVEKHGRIEKITDNYIIASISDSRRPDIDNYIAQQHQYDASQIHTSSIFVIGLISLYDSFIYNLIESIFKHSPERANEIEKQFTIRELLEYNDIDSFKKLAIGEYIEDILRQSHLTQFKKLESILDVTTLRKFDNFHRFIEICERRNLFTHTGGVVNNTYIRKLREAGVKEIELKEGDRAEADSDYLNKAIDIVQEIAIKLIVVTWYKLTKGADKNRIELSVNDLSLEFISDERYALAVSILSFMIYEQPNTPIDANKKMMVINLSNAMKLSGEGGWKEILNKEDWSASSNLFKFAKYSVEEDIDAMGKLLPGLVEQDEISKFALMTWPLFSGVADKSEFKEIYKEAFGEDFVDLNVRKRKKKQPRA